MGARSTPILMASDSIVLASIRKCSAPSRFGPEKDLPVSGKGIKPKYSRILFKNQRIRGKNKKSAKQRTCARRFPAPHRSGSLPSVIGLREGKAPQGDVKDENRAAAVVDTAGKWTYNKERIGAWSKSSF